MTNGLADRDFNVFVGAETGILKGVSINPKLNLSKNFHNLKKLEKEHEITCMSWGESEDEILLGLRNQTVKVYDPGYKSFSESVDCTAGSGPLRGIARFDNALITAAESGTVRVWHYPDPVEFNTVDVEVQTPGRRGKRVFDSEDDETKHKEQLKVGRMLCRMRQNTEQRNLIGTGGRENDLQIWDMNRPAAPVFRAKNVAPDSLQLRVPVWVTDLCFTTPHTPVVSTRHGHIRLYDIRSTQRRPTLELTFPDEALMCIAATDDPERVIVGSAQGAMAMFDFRAERRGMARKYKGCVGSVRDICSVKGTPYFASVGLDRFLRVYSTQTKKIVSKMYLKSRLNCVLLREDFDPLRSEEERTAEKSETSQRAGDSEVEILEEEEDELWDNMEAVGGDKKRKQDEEHKEKRKKIKNKK